MATKKDYQKGERVTVTRKNHHYVGQTGTVSEVYSNGLYVRFEDEKLIGMAFSTVRPALPETPDHHKAIKHHYPGSFPEWQ